MSESSFESDPTEDTYRKGFEALRYLTLPGINDIYHDVHWVIHGDKLGSETPERDEALKDEYPLTARDFARTNPEAQMAAQKVAEAWSDVAWSLGQFLEAKEEFYKVFADAQHGEEKRGDFDLSNVKTPGDL